MRLCHSMKVWAVRERTEWGEKLFRKTFLIQKGVLEIIPVDVHHVPIHTPFVLLQIQQTVTETIILQYSDGDHMLYSEELHNNDIKLNRALLLHSDGTKNGHFGKFSHFIWKGSLKKFQSRYWLTACMGLRNNAACNESESILPFPKLKTHMCRKWIIHDLLQCCHKC